MAAQLKKSKLYYQCHNNENIQKLGTKDSLTKGTNTKW